MKINEAKLCIGLWGVLALLAAWAHSAMLVAVLVAAGVSAIWIF